MSDFQKSFDALVEQCRAYQKEIDKHELWYKEPYQHRYLAMNKVMRIHMDERLTVEALVAGEQSAPGAPSLTPARRHYYKLEEEVPPFLGSGSDSYYYLQTYRIAVTWLMKIFSYSTYKGDWEKSRNLITWLLAIEGKHAQHNAAGSMSSSLNGIKDMGDLDSLSDGELRALEEEVRNIQALLQDNPDLEIDLTDEELALLAEASDFLDTKENTLKGLPKIDKGFKYEPPPAIDALVSRCRQLSIMGDDFTDDYDPEQLVTHLPAFKKDLKDSFDHQVRVCNDVYTAVLKGLGASSQITLGKLCRILHDAFINFTDKDLMLMGYQGDLGGSYLDIQRGLPDTIDLEVLLLTAIGELDNSFFGDDQGGGMGDVWYV